MENKPTPIQQQIDTEWISLLRIAKNLGMSPIEIRSFFQQFYNKTNTKEVPYKSKKYKIKLQQMPKL